LHPARSQGTEEVGQGARRQGGRDPRELVLYSSKAWRRGHSRETQRACSLRCGVKVLVRGIYRFVTSGRGDQTTRNRVRLNGRFLPKPGTEASSVVPVSGLLVDSVPSGLNPWRCRGGGGDDGPAPVAPFCQGFRTTDKLGVVRKPTETLRYVFWLLSPGEREGTRPECLTSSDRVQGSELSPVRHPPAGVGGCCHLVAVAGCCHLTST
jgi:hypothetical protein